MSKPSNNYFQVHIIKLVDGIQFKIARGLKVTKLK